jgi:serine/threonine protein kinase
MPQQQQDTCTSATSSGHQSTTSTVSGGSFHGKILRESKDNVFDKYEILQVLGQGSMGYVAKVRVKSGRVAGSATDPKKKKGGGPLGLGIINVFRRNKEKDGMDNPTAIQETSEHVYAIKTILVERVSPLFIKELENEIDILRSMDHPNIVKAYEVYNHKQQIFVVMQCCDGGDLYTRSPYSEKQAAIMMSCLLSAISYMHDHKVVHRDLKYENIMLYVCVRVCVCLCPPFGGSIWRTQYGLQDDSVTYSFNSII